MRHIYQTSLNPSANVSNLVTVSVKEALSSVLLGMRIHTHHAYGLLICTTCRVLIPVHEFLVTQIIEKS